MLEQAGGPEERSASAGAAAFPGLPGQDIAGLGAPGAPRGADRGTKLVFLSVLAVVGLGIAALVAVAVALAGRHSPRELTIDQYRAGDCLRIPLTLSTTSPWPYQAAVVPCTQRHAVEVFFTGRLWARALPFPGTNVVYSQMTARCDKAFTAYDGVPSYESEFQITIIGPYKANWAQGIRSVQCVVYSPDVPPTYSIKGSHR